MTTPSRRKASTTRKDTAVTENNPVEVSPDAAQAAEQVEVAPDLAERVQVDPENPGDEATTHDEDDDPTSHAGEEIS